MRALQLSPRLKLIAGLVPQGARVCDIGTDHARLPVYLMERGIASSVIATDLNQGPLNAARRLINIHRVDVDLRLGDGAECILPDEADTVIISGIGGDTIIAILEQSPFLTDKHLIIQPQTRIERVEIFLENPVRYETFEGHRRYIIFERKAL